MSRWGPHDGIAESDNSFNPGGALPYGEQPHHDVARPAETSWQHSDSHRGRYVDSNTPYGNQGPYEDQVMTPSWRYSGSHGGRTMNSGTPHESHGTFENDGSVNSAYPAWSQPDSRSAEMFNSGVSYDGRSSFGAANGFVPSSQPQHDGQRFPLGTHSPDYRFTVPNWNSATNFSNPQDDYLTVSASNVTEEYEHSSQNSYHTTPPLPHFQRSTESVYQESQYTDPYDQQYVQPYDQQYGPQYDQQYDQQYTRAVAPSQALPYQSGAVGAEQ
jgi:hypothetical protein